MRILFFFVPFLLLSACMPAVIRRERAAVAKTIVVEDSLLQLTAYYLPTVKWEGETILIFKNVSKHSLTITSPKPWWAVWITLRNAAGEEVQGNKICGIDQTFKEETKELQPGEFLSFDRSFGISLLYSGLPAGIYTVSVSYHGTIKNATGGYIKSRQEIRSAPVQVQIEAQPKW